jgi:ribonuclease P protein component
VKRRLREIFRKERPSESVEIVINARPSAATAEFSELRQDFADLLARALSRGKRPA